MFGSFRFFQRHHSKCRMNLFLPLLFVSLPICIWVDMPTKREKSRKKWQNIFLGLCFAWWSCQNDASSYSPVSRTRVRAPSNSDVDFLLSQVSHKWEIWREKPSKFWRAEEREKRLLVEFSAYFQSLKFVFVKICLEIRRNGLNYSVLPIVLWHLWQQKCKNSCDARIRVRAREGCYRCFHNSNAMFPISVSRIGVFALPTFHWKQHVVFTKTTRRFPQNNTSFLLKQHVVFTKTTRRFHQNNTSFSLKQHVIWRERKTCFVENWDSRFHRARSIFSPWNV